MYVIGCIIVNFVSFNIVLIMILKDYGIYNFF